MRWLKAMLLTAEVAEEYAEERKGRPSSAASAKTSATSAVGFCATVRCAGVPTN
jgi:phosphoheptose isomerase